MGSASWVAASAGAFMGPMGAPIHGVGRSGATSASAGTAWRALAVDPGMTTAPDREVVEGRQWSRFGRLVRSVRLDRTGPVGIGRVDMEQSPCRFEGLAGVPASAGAGWLAVAGDLVAGHQHAS